MARGMTRSRGEYARIKESTPLSVLNSKIIWKPNLKRITEGLFSSKDDKKCPNIPPPEWSHFSDPWVFDVKQQQRSTVSDTSSQRRRDSKRTSLRAPEDTSSWPWEEQRVVDDDIRILRRKLSSLEREARRDVYKSLSQKQTVEDTVNETKHSRKNNAPSIQRPNRKSSLARLETVPYEPLYSASNLSSPSRMQKSRQRNDSFVSNQSIEDPRDFQQFLTASHLATSQDFDRRSLQLAIETQAWDASDGRSITISLPSNASSRSRDSLLMDEIRGFLHAPYAESVYSVSTMDGGDVRSLKKEEFYMECETRGLSSGPSRRNRMSFSIERGWEGD